MTRYQLAIVGSGPGGYVAAIKAAQLGLSVAVVEARDVGGTCLNRGCIPTKTILHAAELLEECERAKLFGVALDAARVDFTTLRTRTADVVATQRGGVESLLEANGVALVRGRAVVTGEGRLEVELADGGTERIEADDIVIATGSSPACPPIPGIDLPGVIDSDDLLSDVPELSRLAIIGGGVVGVEFASAYAAFGTKVTVLEMQNRLLPLMDRELGQSLAMSLKKRGVTVETGAAVRAIEQSDGGLRVVYERKGTETTVEADAVLVSTGRRANTSGLFSDGYEPDMERGRIVTDEHMRTSLPHLYAIGDASTAGPQLAHAASAQGIVAACAVAGSSCGIDLSCVPSCVYTAPEIASVGITEAEAKDSGIAVCTGKYVMGGNGKTVIGALDRSFIKIVASEDGRVLGAQLLCGRASDIVGELALAVAHGLSVDDIASTIHPHPTFVEGVGEAAETLLGGAVHAMPKKRK